jgi:hypothetical protein
MLLDGPVDRCLLQNATAKNIDTQAAAATKYFSPF